jgi:hypothetical protein
VIGTFGQTSIYSNNSFLVNESPLSTKTGGKSINTGLAIAHISCEVGCCVNAGLFPF